MLVKNKTKARVRHEAAKLVLSKLADLKIGACRIGDAGERLEVTVLVEHPTKTVSAITDSLYKSTSGKLGGLRFELVEGELVVSFREHKIPEMREHRCRVTIVSGHIASGPASNSTSVTTPGAGTAVLTRLTGTHHKIKTVVKGQANANTTIPRVLPLVSPSPAMPLNTAQASNRSDILRTIAGELVRLVQSLGFECAFFGSMACKLYGSARLPEDLDILIIPPSTQNVEQEWIKKQLVNRYSRRYYMVPSKNPLATYRVLYARIDQESPLPPNFTRRRCKIDTLLPEIMNLPRLSASQINMIDGLPVVPFMVLLLQKLQGWDDHLKCVEAHKFRKHPVDAADIKNLLDLSPDLPLRMIRPWSEKDVLSVEFRQESEGRVLRFCQSFPETRKQWRALGFSSVV